MLQDQQQQPAAHWYDSAVQEIDQVFLPFGVRVSLMIVYAYKYYFMI